MMRCGLLGEKLGHSYSPAIHAELADYAYKLYEVAPDALAAFLTGGDFDALNVTIPYKKAVIPYCTELSPIAQKLGSVTAAWTLPGRRHSCSETAARPRPFRPCSRSLARA